MITYFTDIQFSDFHSLLKTKQISFERENDQYLTEMPLHNIPFLQTHLFQLRDFKYIKECVYFSLHL